MSTCNETNWIGARLDFEKTLFFSITWSFNGYTETWRGLQATSQVSHPLRNLRASARLEWCRLWFVKDALIKPCTRLSCKKKIPFFCSDNVPYLWGFRYPPGQFFMQHSQVNQDIDGGPHDQDSVMARPSFRPEPLRKPLECDQFN